MRNIDKIKIILSAITHPKNFVFLFKYPFMKVKNVFTGKFLGYKYTEYESIPKGWRNAFGKDLLKDLKEVIKKDNVEIRWEQIKQKYGTLRLCASCGEETQKVLDKYELLSEGYCECCGKPARYITDGWITYLCEECFDKNYTTTRGGIEYKKKCRLTKEDVPQLFQYDKEGKKKIDIKETYNIDFEELWGLKG